MLTQLDFQNVHFHTSVGVVALDNNGIIVYSNPMFCHLLSDEAHLGKPASLFLEEVDGPNYGNDLLSDEGLTDVQYCLKSATESKTVLISSTRFTDASDTLVYLIIRNITSLKKKERLCTYLNSAVEALGSARDMETALAQISDLIVPKFANWFSIDLLKNGKIQELVLTHEDPEMIGWARKYREAYPTDLSGDTGLAGVLKTGKSSFVPIVTEEMILASTPNEVQLQLIQRMKVQSVLIVAITNKSIIKGAITFVSSEQHNYYDENDLEFAESFASHIATALENVRLNETAEAEIIRRKETESELRVTQAQLKSALSSGLVGTWISDLDSDTIYMDENLSRMYGIPYSPIGSHQDIINLVIHPDDLDLLQPQNRSILVEGRFYEAEFRVLRNKHTYWFFARGSLETNEHGKLFGGVVIDITQRKKAELALLENEERFRFLTDAIPHKLWTSNPDGSVNYYNQGWYDYTGIHNFEKLKDTIWDFIHPDERKILEREWPEVIKRGENRSFEHRLRRNDGEYRWHLSRFSAHRNEKGEILLWVGTSTDIEEQKRNEQRKDEFLSIASHELKTPLTSIKAFNQIMARSAPEGNLSKFVNKSAEHIYRLERLIADLLDVTKINAGKLRYNFEEFPVHEMLLHAKENFQYNDTHSIIIQNSANVIVMGDRFRLEQLLDNLLANAIKYSPEADRVVINCTKDDESLIISVQDFGIGIDVEKIEKLFDRYYRVDNTAMRFEGLGLGLYISHEIIKRHQGRIWVESEPGKGSTFYVKFPISPTPETAH
ncbi:ATP-binding protein [Daejeonella sp.]|uniref:ATP-binding protein n=1 Tax=Daejeonella sp. TaxID=2805397 RepID=UPI003982D960